MEKKVSVILTTYNGEAHLREQLDSLLAQTYPLHEIVVQDDGSTDGTWALLEEYAAATKGLVRIFHNEAGHGVNPNVYSAIRRTTGELVAICDQDDIWEPEKIAEQVARIGDNLLIGGQTIPFSTDGSAVAYDSREPNHHVLRMLFASAIPGHSMLLRPKLLEMYESNDVSCFDAQMQVAAAALEKFCYQGVCPVHQRRHAAATTYTAPVNSSRGMTNMLAYLCDCIRIYPKAKPMMLQRMKAWQKLLESMPCNTQSHKEALSMVKLMQEQSTVGRIKLLAFCYRNRRWLFHTVEKDSMMLRIRALLFPLTAVYYFRSIK